MERTMDYPAPWTLTGDGLILCYRPDSAWLAARPADWSGRLAVVMWVNYRSSPVGPYQEWLFIPGQRRNPGGRQYSIRSIFVDSEKSMIGGQQNWGIPKRLAEFDWQDDGVSLQLAMSSEDGEVQVTGAARGPAIPVPALWQPYRIYQRRDGRHFWTRPTARARCRWFSVVSQQEEGPAVPGLASQRLVAAVEVRNFRMTFPEAQIAPVEGYARTG